jgi:hypothetical protein
VPLVDHDRISERREHRAYLFDLLRTRERAATHDGHARADERGRVRHHADDRRAGT